MVSNLLNQLQHVQHNCNNLWHEEGFQESLLNSTGPRSRNQPGIHQKFTFRKARGYRIAFIYLGYHCSIRGNVVLDMVRARIWGWTSEPIIWHFWEQSWKFIEKNSIYQRKRRGSKARTNVTFRPLFLNKIEQWFAAAQKIELKIPFAS